MINKIKNFIEDRQLLVDGERVLVALSGGADSVCLLRVLLHLGYQLEAVHCNFHLRSEESDRDERFVRELCDNLGVKLHVCHFNTRADAKKTGKSIEMMAREQRYEWFASFGLPVAVAHHKNDNAETLLLNLFRGTGIAGMVGMSPCRVMDNGMKVVRPLLCVTRNEIEQFVGGEYVTDSTNLEDDALRNVIRHHLVQMSDATGKDFVEAVNKSAQNMSDAFQLYSEAVKTAVGQCFDCRRKRIDMQALMNTASPRTILFEILSPYGFKSSQTDAVLEEYKGEPGRVYESAEWRLLRDRQCWLLREKNEQYEVLQSFLPLEGDVRVTNDVVLRVSRCPVDGYTISKNVRVASLDLEKLQFPLTVRLVEEGDRFVPFGMRGAKLVSDYLTDRHKTVFEKERQLVLLSGDNIAWVIGERPSALFAVDDRTRFVVKVEAC